MGLFNIFKKKEKESSESNVEPPKPTQRRTILESWTENGIKYHRYKVERISGSGISESFEEVKAEYNEKLAYIAFLSKYKNLKSLDNMSLNRFSNFYLSKYGIENPNKLASELISKGFYSYSDITKKIEISNIGQKWIQDHILDYEYFNLNDDSMSFEEFKKKRNTQTKKNIETDSKNSKFLEICKTIQNDQETFGRLEYDWLIGYYKEKKDFRNVLLCYMKEMLIDLSGATEYVTVKKLDFDLEFIKEMDKVAFVGSPVRGEMPKYKQYFEKKMIDETFAINLPINACKKPMFEELLEIIFDGALDDSTWEDYAKVLNSKIIQLYIRKRREFRAQK